jgi:uncharacterized protein YjbJ (UPF0337 family)
MGRMMRILLAAVLFSASAWALPAHAGTASALTVTHADRGPGVSPNLLLVLHQDQFAGNWTQLQGDLPQRRGDFTDDDLVYIEGRYKKHEGPLQERYGRRKEEIKQWTDEWFKQHDIENETQKTQAR